MYSHVILYGGDRSPHRSIGNTRLVFWTETNFLPDFSICYTVLKDSSYPGSIRNVVYAWNTADRNTSTPSRRRTDVVVQSVAVFTDTDSETAIILAVTLEMLL